MVAIVASDLADRLRLRSARRFVGLLLLSLLIHDPTHAQTAACAPEMAWITSVQGKVEIRQDDTAPWQDARLDDALCLGSIVRVGAYSRAALVFTDDSTLRLDQNTELIVREREQERRTWLEMITGAIHFFSHRPRSLRIDTPFVNAAAEGTEFLIRVGDTEAHILMYEGVVLASNEAGELRLGPNDAALIRRGEQPIPEIVVRPRDAVAWAVHYPPVIPQLAAGAEPGAYPVHLQVAIRRVQENNYPSAIRTLDLVPEAERDAPHETLRAGIFLNIGRVAEAEAAIERALAQDPASSDALALRTVLHVVRNDRAQALRDADRAVQLSPTSSAALIAQSYARQASFDLDGARESLRNAVEQNPTDALAHARLAEIELSFADYDKANDAADRAVQLAPTLARTQTVRGFSHLAEIDTSAARTAFAKAIDLYSADPLPYLGQGLAKIREGDLEAGRRDLEIAASLDPNNALIRSYLGKAYFEEKRGPKDATQFDIAKKLDPNDPTPWFYDAIRKQTENRPVEALRDLEKAIELNDNRAVYRSRLLLDQDRASRTTSVARIYDDLGFQQLAINEATRSLARDPANYSAHRFLADAYSRRIRYEVARASEQLQAQLLQPINFTPRQPSLSVSDLNTSVSVGPGSATFSEFHPLFERNRLGVTASGFAGNNDTFGEELSISGISGKTSFSFGQLHSESDGFRPNNDVENDLFDAFGQVAISPKLGLQAEHIRRRSKSGDLVLGIDPSNFSDARRSSRDEDIFRLGITYRPTIYLTSLFSWIHLEQKVGDFFFFPPSSTFQVDNDDSSDLFEAQMIGSLNTYSFVLGGSYSKTDIQTSIINTFGPTPVLISIDDQLKSSSGYLYSYNQQINDLNFTVGAAVYQIEESTFEGARIQPKLGLEWSPLSDLVLRMAYFETTKRNQRTERSIEPSHVAGFNQLFDETTGTRTQTFGIGADAALLDQIKIGAEFTIRKRERPIISGGIADFREELDELVRGYVYVPVSNNVAFSLEPELGWFDSDEPLGSAAEEARTLVVPVGMRYYFPSGLQFGIDANWVWQDLEEFDNDPNTSIDEEFLTIDASLTKFLPKRRGVVGLEVRNIFNEKFGFQDNNFRNTREREPRFVPDRTYFVRATFDF